MEKIKLFIESERGKDIMVVCIVILVGLGSFQLGRLSKQDASKGLKILPAQAGEYSGQEFGTYVNQSANAISFRESSKNISQDSNSAGKNFFASSRGSKYYSLGCSAGKSIKQVNRVYFATGEEAEQAGYELSSSCR